MIPGIQPFQQAAPPSKSLLFDKQFWSKIEEAEDELMAEEAKGMKHKILVIKNLIKELTEAMHKGEISAEAASRSAKEIVFMVGCYKLRSYPTVKDELHNLNSLYQLKFQNPSKTGDMFNMPRTNSVV